MNARVTAKGAKASFGTVPPVFTLPLATSWGESVELLPVSEGARTRQARVFVRLYGQSCFDRAFIVVRVPVGLPERNAAMLAANRAHGTGKGHSWVMWARMKISEKYGALKGEKAFTQALRNLSAEFDPRRSQEGRSRLEQILKLGNFDSSAFPVGLVKLP